MKIRGIKQSTVASHRQARPGQPLALLAGTLLATGAFAQTPTLSGNNAFTGNNTFPNINNTIYVDGVKYTTVQAAINALNNQPGLVIVPPGTFTSTAAIKIGASGQHLQCSGIKATTLVYSGSATIDGVVSIDPTFNPNYNAGNPATNAVQNASVTNCTISGNSHSKYGISANTTHRSDFSHNSLINVTDAGLHTNFAVAVTLDDLHTSTNEQTMALVPTSCLILDGGTTSTVIKNNVCEGVTGDGWVLLNTIAVTFHGGTSEGNLGRGINIGSSAQFVSIEDVDFESNAIEDILINGKRTTITGATQCTNAGHRIHVGAAGSYVIESTTGGCLVDIADTGSSAIVQADLSSVSLPSAAPAKWVLDSGIQTLSNKTLTSPVVSGGAPSAGAGKLGLGSTTTTTASAGAAGAVPAQAAGYLIINIGGTNYKVPYFN